MKEFRVRFKGGETALTAALIFAWQRSDFPNGPVMSASSGEKDYLKNDICGLFDRDPAIDSVYMLRASGPPFLLIRKGAQYFDVTRREVEVAQKVVKKTTAA